MVIFGFDSIYFHSYYLYTHFSKTVRIIWQRKEEFLKEDNVSLDGRSKKMKLKTKQSEAKVEFEKEMTEKIHALEKKMKIGRSTMRNC